MYMADTLNNQSATKPIINVIRGVKITKHLLLKIFLCNILSLLNSYELNFNLMADQEV